ncbi:phosphatase PAP2 family protein [Priestia endophytica]|uniref:phosphatase PAP2 family protein n=1 Tax=Priestia endophytica TaxID=135735 RepID=UPI00155929D5|nr:phosphatase PAP2 family protein [Priestia endophytica]
MGKLRLTVWLCLMILLFLMIGFTYETSFIVGIDKEVASFASSFQSDAATTVFLFITNLGSWKFILFFTLILFGYSLYKGDKVLTLFVILSFIVPRTLNFMLKEFFARTRPQDQLVPATHFSFPSGHSMNSFVFFGFVAYVLITYCVSRKAPQVVVVVLFSMLIGLIGFSRIYLGVHYFTDVTAGFLAGGVVLILLIKIHQRLTEPEEKKRAHE